MKLLDWAILFVLLLLATIGTIPAYSRGWGYSPFLILCLVLIIVLLLFWFSGDWYPA